MVNLHLNRNEEDAFVEALLSSHRIRVRVGLLNSKERPVGDVTDPGSMVLDGQVDIDVSEDALVSRTLSMTLLDPGHKLAFTPLNPHHGTTFADNFIQVDYSVEVQELDRWIDVPVFCGPLTSFAHNGEQLEIEAQSKERLSLTPHIVLQGYTIHKNTRVDDAMRKVLVKTGERRFSIPRLRKKLTQDVTVRPGEEPWTVIVGGEDIDGKKRTGLIDRTGEHAHNAFFDGEGRFCVRRQRKQRVWTFGPRCLLTKPALDWDVLEAINYVKVKGGRPKGAKESVFGHAKLPTAHPMSPESLSRETPSGEDSPRFMSEIVEATNLLKSEECNKRAEDALEGHTRSVLSASFDSLVIPHLEPYDRVAAITEEGRIEYTLKTFTIPLTSTEGMSVGFTKAVEQIRPRGRHGRNRGSRHRKGRR